MSLLWRLVFTSRCTSTHHKLALDSLRFLRGPMADVWSNLFLANHEQYLTGSKAPDDVFKDFKNHVLHVEQGFWGGATLSARSWYQKTVTALNQGNWPDAIYNAGVLSHYFTDPFQPFHTDQTEAEGKVHRAAEWSITKSYDELTAILEQDLGGYPEYELPERPDWLEEAIRAGATKAHASYHTCIDHYDLNRGIKNPPSGLDQEMKDCLAQLIGLASVGFSRVLERAFEEAAVTPPDVAVSLHAFLATIKMPLNWIMRKITDAHERSVVEAIYLEVQEKGKAIDSLPEDEKTVRKMHAQEVLKIPLRQLDAEPARPAGTQYGTGKPSRGLTIKASATAFERTSISAPLRPTPTTAKDASAGLETCLMVPLATSRPIDHVADTALRALLSQASPERPASPNSPHGQMAASWLNRGVLPPLRISPEGGSSIDLKSPGVSKTAKPKESLSTTTAPAKGPQSAAELPKAERRGERKKLVRPTDSYPEISPPDTALAATLLNYSPASTNSDDAMFAPLPPAPRIKAPERDSKEQAAGIVSPPQTRIPAATLTPAPTTAVKQQFAPAPVVATGTTNSASATNTVRQPSVPLSALRESQTPVLPRHSESRPSGISNANQKSYVAEPATSPIPTPHIRLEETPEASQERHERSVQRSDETRPAASQPRVVVSGSSGSSQTDSKPVNRLPQVASAPSQQPPAPFQAPTTPKGSFPTALANSVPSSLFASVNTPTAPRPEVAQPRPNAVAPKPVPVQTPVVAPTTSAPAAAPKPNMFQRPATPPSPAPQPATSAPAAAPRQASRTTETPIVSVPQSGPTASPKKAESVSETATKLDTPINAVEAPRDAEEKTPGKRERRFYLEPNSAVVHAPSIGHKTAELLEGIGVRTVFDLLKINTDQASEKLGKPQITPAVLKDWQAQALLVCRVPDLRGHDAQYLVWCGIRTAEQLLNCVPQVLLDAVLKLLGTSFGQRLLRGGKPPDLEEVTDWIQAAKEARSLRGE